MSTYKYLFDRYGNSSDNKLIEAEYEFKSGDLKTFILQESLFYTDTLEIKDKTTNADLAIETDYELINFDSSVTVLTGLEAAAGITLKDDSYVGTLLITVQLVGGPEGLRSDAMLQLANALKAASDSPTIDWNTQIKNIPTHFPATLDTVKPENLDDLDLLTQEFTRVANALDQRRPMHDSYNQISEQQHRLIQLMAWLRRDMNSVIAVAGSGAVLADMQEQLKSIETLVSKTTDGFTGIPLTVDSWDIGDVTKISGLISYKTTSGVHSTRVEITHDGTDTVWAKADEQNTADNDLFTLTMSESAGKIHLNLTSVENGELKVKWLAVF